MRLQQSQKHGNLRTRRQWPVKKRRTDNQLLSECSPKTYQFQSVTRDDIFEMRRVNKFNCHHHRISTTPFRCGKWRLFKVLTGVTKLWCFHCGTVIGARPLPKCLQFVNPVLISFLHSTEQLILTGNVGMSLISRQ